ncbi:MAG: hypothetical protein K8R31_04005 [Bacteroidales bacterium]|nr:hypothetical protein [Bacteroidales bacterium]
MHSFFKKLPLYLIIVYPLFGFITFHLTGQQPLFTLIFIILISIFFIFFDKKQLQFPKYLIFYGLFCFIEILSKYFINDLLFAIDANLKRSFFYIFSFFLLLIIENTSFKTTTIKKIEVVLKYLIYTAAVVSIIQFLQPSFLYNAYKREEISDTYILGTRLVSIFDWGDHGYGLGLSLPIMYSLIAPSSFTKKKFPYKITLAAGIVVLLSLTRFAIANFIIALMQYFKNKFSLKKILVLLFGIATIVVIADYIGFDFNYFLYERLSDETYETRFVAIDAFIHEFPKNMYFGTGGVVTESLIDFYGRVTKIHNGYLAILYFYGLVGGLFYYSFIILLIKRIYRVAKISNFWGAFFGILCFLFSNLTVDINHFLVSGLILMVLFNKYYYDSIKTNNRLLQNE